MQASTGDRTPPAEDGRERLFVRPETHDVSVSESDDGLPEITVPISSTTEHRSGLLITTSALESMVDQLREGTVGLWDDHGLDEMGWPEYRREDRYGWWVDGELDDNDVLWGTARLRPDDERTQSLLSDLEIGAPVAFSIGHRPSEEDEVEREDGSLRREVNDTDLMETSAVGIPDNPDAYADAEVDAAARMIAHAVGDRGVPLTRETASVVADGVADALTHMGDADTHDETDEEKGEDDEDEETNDGGPSETNQDEVEELLEAFAGVVDNRLEAHREEMRAMLEDLLGYDDDEDEQESAEGDKDEDEEETESNSVDEEIEQLRAKLDRLESEQRQSAGRRGIVTTNDADADVGDEGEETSAETNSGQPRDAYMAFQED